MNATDKKFREGLEGYEVKPSDQVWERVESALPEREDEKVVVLWYRYAAAAAILLIFGLGWMSRDWTSTGPDQQQIAAKPTEELEEAQSSKTETEESSTTQNDTGIESQNDDSNALTNTEETQGEMGTESASQGTPKANTNSPRTREEFITLPRATVNLASVDFNQYMKLPVDNRKKYNIELQFVNPPSQELIASAEPQKKSITEYAGEQWQAINGLQFGKLEDPRGKVALPKIDRDAIEKIFNRDKQ